MTRFEIWIHSATNTRFTRHVQLTLHIPHGVTVRPSPYCALEQHRLAMSKIMVLATVLNVYAYLECG